MKISIITPTFNCDKTVVNTIKSFLEQTYSQKEHIVIDGGSTDRTYELLKKFNHYAFLESKLDKGIFNAFNKGVKKCSGDIIGFLHADDIFYSRDTLESIADYFLDNPNLDGLYGDVVFVNSSGHIRRYYDSSKFKFNNFSKGDMPAHTSFFARRKVYDQFKFDESYKVSGDFKHLLEVFKSERFNIEYRKILTTQMLLGGNSNQNLRTTFKLNSEIIRACREVGVPTNYLKVYSKYFSKLKQLRA